jgi:hypothetical protein
MADTNFSGWEWNFRNSATTLVFNRFCSRKLLGTNMNFQNTVYKPTVVRTASLQILLLHGKAVRAIPSILPFLWHECNSASTIWLDFMKRWFNVSQSSWAEISRSLQWHAKDWTAPSNSCCWGLRSCRMLQCVDGYFVTDVSLELVVLFLMSKRSNKLLHHGESLNSPTFAAVTLLRSWSACVVYGSQLHVVLFTLHNECVLLLQYPDTTCQLAGKGGLPHSVRPCLSCAVCRWLKFQHTSGNV